MKITIYESMQTVNFDQIFIGDTFIVPNKDEQHPSALFMKIPTTRLNGTNSLKNAVLLNEGTLFWFPNSEECVKTDCEVRVKKVRYETD